MSPAIVLAQNLVLGAEPQTPSGLDAFYKFLGAYWLQLAATCAAIVVAVVVSTLVARRATRGIADEVRRHKARRTVVYLAQFVALAVIAVTWAATLNFQLWIGLASVGVALALQNVILCAAGWLYLNLRRPYDIGDRIQAGKLIGDVLDIRLFHTYLIEVGNWVDADQSTGRVVYLPNSTLFTQPIFNYTQGFPYVWDELPILVTFESDWRRAKEVLEQLAQDQARDMGETVGQLIVRMKRDYPIRYEHLTPIVYTRIKESGVLLTIRYLTGVRDRRRTAAELYESVLAAFAREPKISFAYPTYRMVGGAALSPPRDPQPRGQEPAGADDDQEDRDDR